MVERPRSNRKHKRSISIEESLSGLSIGSGGIERIADIQLDNHEQIMFDNSVNAVRGLVDACRAIDPNLK